MARDPLRELIEGHTRVSEWLHNLDAALELVGTGGKPDVEKIEAYFSEYVRDHFLYEEEHVFPALLEASDDPELARMIDELRGDHVRILTAAGRLMPDLAAWVAGVPGASEAADLAERAGALAEEVLKHAAREDQYLLPLVETHLVDLSMD